MKSFLSLFICVMCLIASVSCAKREPMPEKESQTEAKSEEPKEEIMYKNGSIVIFGDSYSTYEGMIPEGFATWYPKLDVTAVSKTWWAMLVKQTDSVLVRNDSWSGSTLGYTGYNNSDTSGSSSFIYRYRNLRDEGFFESNTVDTVLVFGGTNDSWSGAPLGKMMYGGWEEEDLYYVLPAICYFAYTLKTDLPDARIVFIINTDISAEIQNAMRDAAEYYGIESVKLRRIGKDERHPNAEGMAQICEQVLDALNKNAKNN